MVLQPLDEWQVGMQCFSAPGELFAATLRKHDGLGGFVTTQWEMRALFDAEGQPEGIFCIGYNITEFIDTRSRLDNARHQLYDIGLIQSHSVRKPLANIIALSGIIGQDATDKRIRHLCDLLQKSTAELDEVIRDISRKTD